MQCLYYKNTIFLNTECFTISCLSAGFSCTFQSTFDHDIKLLYYYGSQMHLEPHRWISCWSDFLFRILGLPFQKYTRNILYDCGLDFRPDDWTITRMSFDIPFEDGKGIELGRPYWEFLSWPEIQFILTLSNNSQ